MDFKVRAARSMVAMTMVIATGGLPRTANADPLTECVDAHERGQELKSRGELLGARQAFLACNTNAECPVEVRTSCSEFLETLRRELPSIVLRAEGLNGRDEPLAECRIDNVSMDCGKGGSALEIDPGSHRVDVIALNGQRAQIDIIASVGVKSRLVTAKLTSSQSALPPESDDLFGPEVWVVGGLGAAAITAGAVLGVVSLFKASDLEERCPPCRKEDIEDDYNEMRNLGVATDVNLAVGGALIVTSVIIAIAQPSRSSSALNRGLTFEF
jgi:hypothetical protein